MMRMPVIAQSLLLSFPCALAMLDPDCPDLAATGGRDSALSFSLEIDGMWPWNQWRVAPQKPPSES